MFAAYRRWRRRRFLTRHALPQETWAAVLACYPFMRRLSDAERERLGGQAALFLREKAITGAGGLALTDAMRLHIAAQACMLVVNLDFEYFRGWSEVIVYPEEFVPRHEYVDDAGVVHTVHEARMGEAWLGGPVILSWADIAPAAWGDGINVVIHEFAHKLDMLNGDADGFPPLHAGMSRAEWTRLFSEAYDDFRARLVRNEDTAIDPYAAESPGEFFAVLSEAFFETPQALLACYPGVYRQLARFYRQDPLAPGGM